ncbi:MAG: glucosamine-6-phosphate deaminase [Ruminococcaceae bacterium]|nr:glucosamine-6-phosphate deaminase [Oscillospiraceae bacterium]MBQ7301952.1 glucosamine-6-phosphate deaminase [Clostridia bacterium]
MKFIVCKNYDEVMTEAAAIVAGVVREKPDCILGLATGSTPLGMYDRLVAEYEAGKLDFSRVSSFNLDEYYPISPDNDQSYRYFMNTNLFNRINIDKANTRVPNGSAADPEQECKDYEAAIDASAGVDIQVLGIGQNGHIAFNEPEDKLYAYTHLTGLTENTIKANSRFFENESDVPRQALTMGMASIMKARKIILLATGAAKCEAVKELLSDRITTAVPASLLKLHPDVTVICDEAAYNCN